MALVREHKFLGCCGFVYKFEQFPSDSVRVGAATFYIVKIAEQLKQTREREHLLCINERHEGHMSAPTRNKFDCEERKTIKS